MSSRIYEVHDGIQFDRDNLDGAAQHVYMRNDYLRGKVKSAEAASGLIRGEVIDRIKKGKFTPGAMELVYRAFFVADPIAPGTLGAPVDAQWEVNFFVRPGRQPPLDVVQASS